MRYFALALAVVLAAAASCPAELVAVTTTLDTPGSPNPNTFGVVCELSMPGPFGPLTASDSDTATAVGISRMQLNCTFNGTTHAVSSVDSIKFLYGDGASDPGPLDFTDVDFTLVYPFGAGTLHVFSTDLAGSNSTGRQENNQDPNAIPFVPVNGSGQFVLNIEPNTSPANDQLLYLCQGMFIMEGTYGGSPVYVPWDLAASEAWNDGSPMAGNGTVTASLASVAPGLATYNVDVSIPMVSAFPVWNPGIDGAPNPLGYVTATGTMEMAGTFSRVIPMPAAGDANADGVVDNKDASILGKNWLQSGASIGWAQGDFNNDDVVNDKDAAVLADHWGDTSEGAAVPEPSTLVLLAGLALAGLLARRR